MTQNMKEKWVPNVPSERTLLKLPQLHSLSFIAQIAPECREVSDHIAPYDIVILTLFAVFRIEGARKCLSLMDHPGLESQWEHRKRDP
eukprot:1667598-Amphidinium_carterae.1